MMVIIIIMMEIKIIKIKNKGIKLIKKNKIKNINRMIILINSNNHHLNHQIMMMMILKVNHRVMTHQVRVIKKKRPEIVIMKEVNKRIKKIAG
jgi:hypothetical protein